MVRDAMLHYLATLHQIQGFRGRLPPSEPAAYLKGLGNTLGLAPTAG